MAQASIGSYPLEVVASSRSGAGNPLPAGAFAVLTVELTIDGVPWLGGAPAFVAGRINERALKNLVRAAVDYNQSKKKKKATARTRAKVHR